MGGSLRARGDDGREGVRGSGPRDGRQIRRGQHGRPGSGPCVLQVLLCLTLGFNRGAARPRAGRRRRGAPLHPAGDTRATGAALGTLGSSLGEETELGVRRADPRPAARAWGRSPLPSVLRQEAPGPSGWPPPPAARLVAFGHRSKASKAARGRSNQHYHLEGPWGGPGTRGPGCTAQNPPSPRPRPEMRPGAAGCARA